MSFINEALKKAQKDRDTLRVRYQGVIAARKQRRSSYTLKIICLFILIIIFFVLGLQIYRYLNVENDTLPEQVEHTIQESIKPVINSETSPELALIIERALFFFKGSNLKEAKKLYQKALKLDPGYVDALNNLGVICINEKEYDTAQENLEKAIRLKPSYVDPYYNLACLFSLTGELNQGLLYLKKAISINPVAKAWAEKDSDIKELRELPEFINIING